MSIKEELFGDLDSKAISDDVMFKEDSVREVILLPIIKKLGYVESSIVRNMTIKEKIGSTKKETLLFIDYLLKIEGKYACVIEAKAPHKKISDDVNIEQAYNYASSRKIRSTYFALCNGIEFSLYRTDNPDEPILLFQITEIDSNWDSLIKYLSPKSFHSGKTIVYEKPKLSSWTDYSTRPLLHEIPVKKQSAKRHFGCNAYFTRQSWDILSNYIENFSKPGDVVLDPFGGSGVTLIEAMMKERKAVHVDLNPLSIFMTKSLLTPCDLNRLTEAKEEIIKEFNSQVPKNDNEIKQALKKYPLPKGLDNSLPKGSDVATVRGLFTKRQLAELAILKSLINKVKEENVRKSLMLAFYNTITLCNLTVHESPGRPGGGHHFGFYYRYRMAYEPYFHSTMKIFAKKVENILNGKKEMKYYINDRTIDNAQIVKGSATDLSFLKKDSVDYIYTDPPYGKKIAYLDLSTMWNAWLDLEVTEEDFRMEAIEGGEHNKSKTEYKALISQSIKEMYRVLKFDRWMSFVFAHKDPEFWHLIIETAERVGFTYVGAVPQKNGQTSFKKRQNPFTILSGQLIINFRKDKSPTAFLKANLGLEIGEIVMQTIEGIIAKNDGATLEQINDEIIIRGLELGFLDLLKKNLIDISAILSVKFDFNEETELFTIKKGGKFVTKIDDKLKIRFYLTSCLRRWERENKPATFDELVMEIMPLLRNGDTPENQTILNVLESIAFKTSDNNWRLKREGQLTIGDVF